MLSAILFLALIVVVAVLITVDVIRTPTEAVVGSADRHGPDERVMAGARSVPGVHAFSREPAPREKPVPPPVAATARPGPAEVDSFERTGLLDQARHETPRPAVGEAALHSKFNTMYLNLSRRSQALVERQLRLIESLEYGEQDQQRLASLSKLNRIAMRMHRNSQNLLVLTGQEPTTSWKQPVTLAHLVEAAVAEAEDYERVSFEVQPDIAVRGPAVHDAVHLLVELIDNATSFSAADMPVGITGRILSSGGALIDITDRGIGMPANEMAYANQQLDNPSTPDGDVPKWMGLLVVARLAARHGIRVRLNHAELGGLTALVWFPDEILTHYSAAVDSGLAESRAASAAYAAARMPTPDVPATRAEPAWSGRGRQAMVPAEPLAAARLPGRPDAPSGDGGVVMPRAEITRRLPIFDEVESRWSQGGREAPGGLAAAPSPAQSGLPRRPPPTAAGPRPNTPPVLPNRPGSRQSWATPPEEANPGPDES
jgi:signal transduction histidine kinase